MDQRAIGERQDVLKFSTPVLESPVEVTGRITVELWAESDAPDLISWPNWLMSIPMALNG
jgi:predicted acyl esterase